MEREENKNYRNLGLFKYLCLKKKDKVDGNDPGEIVCLGQRESSFG